MLFPNPHKALFVSRHMITDLPFRYKREFLTFLKGELPLDELENFISQTTNLEKEVGTDTYIDLLTFNYKDKNAATHLESYILMKIISESEFETWKITELLQSFVNHPAKAKEHLDEIYHLFCKSYNRQRELTNGYRFLGHLGLNYLYWIDEGYLRTTYGDKWQIEYMKSLKYIEHYQQQLKPIAEQILNAFSQGEIKIMRKGEYQISEQLRSEMEGDTIFKLKHPE